MTRAYSRNAETSIIEGEAALARGDFRTAEDHFLSVARLPQAGPALFHLAHLAISHGSLDFAEALLRRGLEEDSSDAGMWNNLGVVLVRSGRANAAADAFASAAGLMPSFGDATENLERITNGGAAGWRVTRTRVKGQRQSTPLADAA
jgi:Flp pilus assembly protein TadD